MKSAAGCDSIATLNLAVNSTLTSTTNTTICSNQLPYTWNGQTINTAGTYTANLKSTAGCDSIATLNLAVNSTLTSSTNTTLCSNQLPYTWNRQTINAAGTYTANLKSIAGCDSTATLNLAVNSTLTSATNTNLCSNQLPYTWNGQTINTAGTYTANLKSTAGCDSTATLNLTVNSTLTSTTNTTICSNQLPYSWNGQIINTPGTYTKNLTSTAGCDSIATLILNISVAVNTFQNVKTCATSYTLPNGVTATTNGVYTSTLKTITGCDSIIITTLVLGQAPILKINNPAASCAPATIDLTATTITAGSDAGLAYTYWTDTTAVNALPTPTAVTNSGTYYIKGTDPSGCYAISPVTITINASPHLIINNPFECAPATVDLTSFLITAGSDQGLRYTYWVDPAAVTPLNNPAAVVNGTYYIKGTATGGCSSIKPVVVTITNAPNLVITNPAAACSGTMDLTAASITIGSDPGLTYTYWTDAASTIPLANPTRVSVSGVYYIKATAIGGCFTIRPVSILFVPAPAVILTGGEPVCAGTSATLHMELTGTPPWNVTYSDGATTKTINRILTSSYDLVVTPDTTANYTILSVADAICTNESPTGSPVVVTVKDRIAPLRYPDVKTFAYVPTQLAARNPGNNYTYQWAPADGLDRPDVYNPVFKYGQSKEYTITLTSTEGCTTVDTQLVVLANPEAGNLAPDLFVPKAWTPNGDGANDYLYPICVHIKELNYFRVFNRWGQLMFETNMIGKGWDGNYNGKPQVMDVYTWTAQAVGDNGIIIKRSGNAMLLR